tara:strand:- start:78 stop:560 length:483 start_codon:yes stop_codon:yes gene_type:complete
MAKKYGQTDISTYRENLKKDQAERTEKFKKLFSGPLFPKGTGGLFPKYDAALKKKQADVEIDMPKAKTKSTVSTNVGVSLHGGAKKKSKVGSEATKSLRKDDKKPKSFDEAFKMAKGQKTFTFKGKSYARVTKDEMEKAGFKSLRAYLNAQKRTKVAKRP